MVPVKMVFIVEKTIKHVFNACPDKGTPINLIIDVLYMCGGFR